MKKQLWELFVEQKVLKLGGVSIKHSDRKNPDTINHLKQTSKADEILLSECAIKGYISIHLVIIH